MKRVRTWETLFVTHVTNPDDTPHGHFSERPESLDAAHKLIASSKAPKEGRGEYNDYWAGQKYLIVKKTTVEKVLYSEDGINIEYTEDERYQDAVMAISRELTERKINFLLTFYSGQATFEIGDNKIEVIKFDKWTSVKFIGTTDTSSFALDNSTDVLIEWLRGLSWTGKPVAEDRAEPKRYDPDIDNNELASCLTQMMSDIQAGTLKDIGNTWYILFGPSYIRAAANALCADRPADLKAIEDTFKIEDKVERCVALHDIIASVPFDIWDTVIANLLGEGL